MIGNRFLRWLKQLKRLQMWLSPDPRKQTRQHWFKPQLKGLEDRVTPAFVINPNFDISITSDANSATIQSTITAAIQGYESFFSNNITVNITFKKDTTISLARTTFSFVNETYSDYLTALSNAATNNPALTLALASLPNSAINPANNNASIELKRANARALGFSTAAGTDATISINTPNCNLDRTSIIPTKFDLSSVVSHEIDEALGLGSALDFTINNDDPPPTGPVEPDDLYRYNQAGARIFDTHLGTQAFYSIDGGTTDLARFNQTAGGDFGDWFSTAAHPFQVQDASATSEATDTMAAELIRLEVAGYTPIHNSLNSAGMLTINNDTTVDLRLPSNNNQILQVFENKGKVTDNAFFFPDQVYASFMVKQINVNTAGANAGLFLDFSGGKIVPSSGINYNGGAGPKATLNLFGSLPSGASINEVDNPTSPNAGTIALDGSTITYSNLSTIVDTLMVKNLTINDPKANDTINVINDPNTPQNGFQTTQVNGTGFVLMDFANKTNVTINDNGGGGTFNVNNPSPGVGLTTIALNGPAGTGDNFNIISQFPGSATLKINGVAVVPNFTISNPTPFAEGDSGTRNMLFVVTRSGNTATAVQVHYATQDGTALAGTDYAQTTGDLSFVANQTTATIAVPVIGNTLIQSNRTFSVILSNPMASAAFATQQTFATGTFAVSVALGDVNGDGKLDIVDSNRQSNTVSVLLNTTPPGAVSASFGLQQTFATGSHPSSVALGDVNGDGKPDIIVANFNSATVSVLLNTTPPGATSPSFAAQQTFASGSYPISVTLADVNGDGKPDILVPNWSSATVSVLLNTTPPGATSPSFAAQQTFATGIGSYSVMLADVNGDGKLDIVDSNRISNTVSVLLNTTPPGAASSSFATQQTFATGNFPSRVVLGDVNGDGKSDILVANAASNTVSVLLNTTPPGATSPSFAAQQTFATGSYAVSVALGDVNGDGKPDLIIANDQSGTVSLLLLNTTMPGAAFPSFVTQQSFAAGSSLSVTLGDINGDGKPDIVYANYNSVSVLLNAFIPITVTPSFSTQPTFATGNGPQSTALGDVNGDGKPDLIVANGFGATVSVLLNTTPSGAATISFATQQTLDVGSNPSRVVFRDVNGDGKPDIITANVFSNTVSVLLNMTAPGAASPSFATLQTFGTDIGPYVMTVGDVNGDGKPDLVVTNRISNTVSVLLNMTAPGAASPNFATQQTFATGNHPTSVVLGDVNGDGKPDILVTNYYSNTVSVLLNMTAPGAASPSFAVQLTFAACTDPHSLVLGDVNGDGKPDLIVANRNDPTVSVLLNTWAPGPTAPGFASPQTFAAGGHPYDVALGDVNGDGKPDLIVSDGYYKANNRFYHDHTVSMLLNTTTLGATAASFGLQQTFATGQDPTIVALGDVNGDGKPDIITANHFDKTVSVLLNNPVALTVSGPATGTIQDDDAPVAIVPATGKYQSATVNTVYAPLAVNVTNAAGHLVQGVSVTFPAPSGGAGGTFPGNQTSVTVTTNANGLAIAPMFTANASSGNYIVSASVSGVSNTAVFNLANTSDIGSADHFVLTSSPSSVTAGSNFALLILAQDASNNPVNFTGTVTLTSSDPLVSLEGTASLNGGIGVATVVLKTATPSGWSITAANGIHSGQTSPILVTPAPASRFAVTAPSVTPSATIAANGATEAGTTVTITTTSNHGFAIGQNVLVSGLGVSGYNGTFTILTTPTPSSFTYMVPTSNLANSGGGKAKSFSITGSPFTETVTALDPFGNIDTNYHGTVHLFGSDASATFATTGLLPGNNYVFTTGAGQDNGVRSFITTLNTAKASGQTLTATDTTATNPSVTGTSTGIATLGLVVTNVTPSLTGFSAAFDKAFVTSVINLYGAGASIPDVTLTGALNGPINGSIIMNSTGTGFTFHASTDFLYGLPGFASGPNWEPALPADTYTITVASGANAFKDTTNAPLDGAANGGNSPFTTTFTVTTAQSSVPIITIPDFARGPDGANVIKVPSFFGSGTGFGIPIYLWNATNVTASTFTLNYNPALLGISGTSTGDSTDTSATQNGVPTFSLVSNDAVNGVATFSYSNTKPQDGTLSGPFGEAIVMGDILATVPNIAVNKYRMKAPMIVSTITINGIGSGTTGAVGQTGWQLNTYLGDATGDGAITPADALVSARVFGGLDRGFANYPLTDPNLVAGSSGSNTLGGFDVFQLNNVTSGHPVAGIPTPALTPTAFGPDPSLSLPAALAVNNGIVTVPVTLDHPRPDGSAGMTEALLALTYDPNVLSLSPADITLGSVPLSGTDWHLSSVIDPETGQIGIELFSLSPITDATGGSLVNLVFHLIPGASVSATSVALVGSVTPNGQYYPTAVADAAGPFVLTPMPINGPRTIRTTVEVNGISAISVSQLLVDQVHAEANTSATPDEDLIVLAEEATTPAEANKPAAAAVHPFDLSAVLEAVAPLTRSIQPGDGLLASLGSAVRLALDHGTMALPNAAVVTPSDIQSLFSGVAGENIRIPMGIDDITPDEGTSDDGVGIDILSQDDGLASRIKHADAD